MTFRHGRQYMTTTAASAGMAHGRRFMTASMSVCDWRPAGQSQRSHYRQPDGQNRFKRGDRGYDAGKKITGRKRHLVVDTLGLIMAIVVHAADIQDRDGARLVLSKLKDHFSRLSLIWADGGYAGRLLDWAAEFGNWLLQIVKRSDDMQGFKVLPRRWVVERTLSWLGKYRRLSKDYESLTASSEAMILLAMINLMIHRLKPG